MEKYAKYNNTVVRLRTTFGSVFTGECEYCSPDFVEYELGVNEEGLKIRGTLVEDGVTEEVENFIVYGSLVEEIEMLRPEACFPVRDWPEAKEEIAEWFHERWGVPLEAYQKSISACLREEDSVPQWYVVVRGSKIIAGCGVIENDFHERKDLTPNVCAVYVDEEYRNQGIAGYLLQYVCKDMARMGFTTLYLLTDHTGFYERYGWEFYCEVPGSDGEMSRMYVHHAE